MPHVAQDRAEALVKAGHEVHVLTTGGGPAEELVNGVTVHHLVCPPQVYSREFADACTKACCGLQPEILHLDSADFTRPWWKSRPGNPRRVAITLHGFEMGAFLTKWNMYRTGRTSEEPKFPAKMIKEHCDILERTFDKVIAISEHEYRLLTDCYALSNTELIYNPIPDYFFENRQEKLPEGKRRFLCAAVSGHRERGFDIAQECAAAAAVELVIVKDKPRTDMPAILDSCHGVVLPTFYAQGFDLVVAESMARLRPVIASNTGSYYDNDSRSGGPLIRVRPADKPALIAAMQGPLPAIMPGLAGSFSASRHVRCWEKAID